MQIDKMEMLNKSKSCGVVKLWDNFKTFSKNLTINTIIITLIILFLSWSRLLIFNVDSENFPLAKSISLVAIPIPSFWDS